MDEPSRSWRDLDPRPSSGRNGSDAELRAVRLERTGPIDPQILSYPDAWLGTAFDGDPATQFPKQQDKARRGQAAWKALTADLVTAAMGRTHQRAYASAIRDLGAGLGVLAKRQHGN